MTAVTNPIEPYPTPGPAIGDQAPVSRHNPPVQQNPHVQSNVVYPVYEDSGDAHNHGFQYWYNHTMKTQFSSKWTTLPNVLAFVALVFAIAALGQASQASSTLNTEIEDLRSTIDKSDDVTGRSSASIKGRSTTGDQTVSEIVAEQTGEISGQLEDLNKTMEEAEETFSQLAANLSDVEANQANLENGMLDLESGIDDLKNAQENIYSNVTDVIAEEAQQLNNSLSQALENSTAALENVSGQVSSLDSKQQELEISMANLESEVQEFEKMQQEVLGNISSIVTELVQLQQETDNLETTLAGHEDDFTKLSNDVNAAVGMVKCIRGVYVDNTCYLLLFRIGYPRVRSNVVSLCSFNGGQIAGIKTAEAYNAVFDYIKHTWSLNMENHDATFVDVWLDGTYESETYTLSNGDTGYIKWGSVQPTSGKIHVGMRVGIHPDHSANDKWEGMWTTAVTHTAAPLCQFDVS